ncbi:MAG: C45 family autoproteolytic acyltransferase/hydrolase, partial [Dongiaceae bacterium]
MELVFEAVAEREPGPRWQANFATHWPSYRRWFEAEGIDARPSRAEGESMLRRHMPELLPTWERLCGLVDDDVEAVRFLTLYRPPAYLGGCSQVVWTAGEPVLIRNYDYSPALCEGLLLLSHWNGRDVLAMSDCLWGALDGVNDAGLAISLTFGGRQVVGDGFGIPLLLRYILEFCGTVAEAAEALKRVPSHMAYNVTAVDRTGSYITAFVAPDRPALVRPHPIATI